MDFERILNIIMQNVYFCMCHFINNDVNFITDVLPFLKCGEYTKESLKNSYYDVLNTKIKEKNLLIIYNLKNELKSEKKYLIIPYMMNYF